MKKIHLLLIPALFCAAPLIADTVVPKDFTGYWGPLDDAQLKQQQVYNDLLKTNPAAAAAYKSKPPVPNPDDPDAGPGDMIYANMEAAKINGVDAALGEIGIGVRVPGELPADAVVKDYGGKRYFCDASACSQCPNFDCASVIPREEMPSNRSLLAYATPMAGSASSGLSAGVSGFASAGRSASAVASAAAGASAVSRGVGVVLGNAAGASEGAGGSGSAGTSTAHRSDEPAPKSVATLVQETVLPGVAPLVAEQQAAAATASVTQTGKAGFGGVGAAGGKAGGAGGVHYTGGSFDSLGDINNSKALGDAGTMLDDKSSKDKGQ